MAGRSPQTHAKRARELALKEKRERKRARKVDRANAAAAVTAAREDGDAPDPEERAVGDDA